MTGYRYEFHFAAAPIIHFEVGPSRPKGTGPTPLRHAAWTRLDFHQCDGCPLTSATHSHCPVAIDIEAVAVAFREVISYTRTTVRVIAAQRTYVKDCDVQSGLNSLLGLIMANSCCPILSQFRPMAHFHLPFSSIEETIYRTASAYLTKQYFLHQDGLSPDLDLDGLDILYEQLQQINSDLVTRVRAASHADANMNAVTTFFSISTIVAMTMRQQLDALRPLFFGQPDCTPS